MGIQFNQVTFVYKGIKTQYKALENINLDIKEEGEFIAICGKTGSGKSTLVQHTNALMQPSFGTVNIFGQILPAKKREKINHVRQKVGLVFQFPEYQLFEETIIKDVSFGPKNFHVSAEDALKQAKKACKTVGVGEELYEQSPFRISGGQMRRVAIAGILAMNPKILVLDEPTRGLDPQGKTDVMDVFLNIHENENKSILLITHDMDIVAEYAKRVVVLDEGKIVFDGTKEELFAHPEFETFHLDYPSPMKVLKHFEKTLNIPFKQVYTMDEVLTYLKEVSHE